MKNSSKFIFSGISLLLILALVFSIKFLIERSSVTKVVDDEAMWDLRDASPCMKVIIANDGTVARYVSEDADSYVGDIQDTFTIPRNDAIVETWYASDGKGIVFLKDFGKRPVYTAQDSTSTVLGEMEYNEGECPLTYGCTGFENGWFSIDVNGVTGYISEDYVEWDVMDTF